MKSEDFNMNIPECNSGYHWNMLENPTGFNVFPFEVQLQNVATDSMFLQSKNHQ
jgi:hypothetical protein